MNNKNNSTEFEEFDSDLTTLLQQPNFNKLSSHHPLQKIKRNLFYNIIYGVLLSIIYIVILIYFKIVFEKLKNKLIS